jgi:hypothetical protein
MRRLVSTEIHEIQRIDEHLSTDICRWSTMQSNLLNADRHRSLSGHGDRSDNPDGCWLITFFQGYTFDHVITRAFTSSASHLLSRVVD